MLQRSFEIRLLGADGVISTVSIFAENVTAARRRATEIATEMAATDFYIKAPPSNPVLRRPAQPVRTALLPLGPYFMALFGIRWRHPDQGPPASV
ncbi:MAG TPA: hypothetical protein VG798_05500 [Rhizomicrobium sp.]|nr:hypothetical protein [Rhizomicrobium sp.]